MLERDFARSLALQVAVSTVAPGPSGASTYGTATGTISAASATEGPVALRTYASLVRERHQLLQVQWPALLLLCVQRKCG